MAASVTFTGPGGTDPVSHIISIENALVPTVGDGLYAGQLLRSRILERTAEGVDVNGIPFAPYAENHPYYLYTNRGMGASRGARAGAAARQFLKTGRAGRRTSMGIRYDSYGAAKAAHGHTNVDLFGLEQHTHMLNTIMVKVGATEATEGAPPAATDEPAPATDIRIGFYGEEADRARGNNEGTNHLPQRRFFDASQQDVDLMGESITARMILRAKAT